MLRGFLRVLHGTAMDRIHEASLRVLEGTGLQIRGKFRSRLRYCITSVPARRSTAKEGHALF